MKVATVKADYRKPTETQALVVLDEARRHVRVTGWRPIYLRMDEIVPRENIFWLNEKDFREWKAPLIELYRDDPAAVPPVVVARLRHRYVIMDGHHRYRAALLARRPGLWVLDVKGKVVAPDFRETLEEWM